MRTRSITFLVAAGVIASVIVGCDRATPIPDGAQQVHVVITDDAITLEPDVVQAGDVYLVLDEPATGSFTFVERRATAEETPGPMTEEDLERLALGDTGGMSISGLDAGGCSPEQNAEDLGRMGPCGNVMLYVVAPGRYAVVSGDVDLDPATGASPLIAVLEVVP